ncbi:MAG: TonB-dependent receptor [Lewinellaceae bacterium]|nr:TonB-dependent receptor [Lewinellaceae bacterium]
MESFVEFNLLKAINPSAPYSLSLFSSYAYIDSEYLNSQFKGNRVELAPEHLFKAGITFKGYHFSTTLNYTNTSSQYSDANNTEFTETGNQGLIPAYEVFDLSANYDIKYYIGIIIVDTYLRELLVISSFRLPGYSGKRSELDHPVSAEISGLIC